MKQIPSWEANIR